MEDKIHKLEEKFYKIENQVARLDWEIKWKLDSIEKLLLGKVDESSILITHIEKQKVNEKRFEKIEEKQEKIQQQLNSINLKIAMVSWAWAVAMFIINKI